MAEPSDVWVSKSIGTFSLDILLHILASLSQRPTDITKLLHTFVMLFQACTAASFRFPFLFYSFSPFSLFSAGEMHAELGSGLVICLCRQCALGQCLHDETLPN